MTRPSSGSDGPRTGRWRRVLKRVLLGSLLALVLLVVGLEAGLWLRPQVLGPAFYDQVVSNFYAGPGGIYYYDEETRLRVGRRNYHSRMTAGKFHWDHQSDSRGFRNPEGTGSEVVVMGDSHVYGLGVEEPQTLCAQMRTKYDVQAYNMGRQGDSLTQHLVWSHLYFEELRPKVVFLFVFCNDFSDVVQYRRLNSDPPELKWDYQALRERFRGPSPPESESKLRYLRTYRLARALLLIYRPHYIVEPQRPLLPPSTIRLPFRAVLDEAVFSLCQAYYRKVLPAIQQQCKEVGAELRVVYLRLPFLGLWVGTQDLSEQFIAELCKELEIPYATTRGLFVDRPECLLPGDGHPSPEGHRLLAEFLRNWLIKVPPKVPLLKGTL